MTGNFYESDRAVAQYLLAHYGAPEEILPYSFGPKEALDFAARSVRETVDWERLPKAARALELGCAVGRASFELARHCARVCGLDASHRFIKIASHLQQQGSFTYAYAEEGDLPVPATAVVPMEIDRSRVTFERGDAMNVRSDLGSFDVVLLSNLIDRLSDPRRCLEQLPNFVKPGGQLVIASPYTWLEQFTPRPNWLGGFEHQGRKIRTQDTLKEILSPHFELLSVKDLPFLVREHARKFEWNIAEASTWVRKGREAE